MKKLLTSLNQVKKTDITVNSPMAGTRLANELIKILKKNHISEKQLIIMCIGTDRSTGDSLGPFVGSRLARLLPSQVKVYGTLSNPVHAVNLEDKLKHVNSYFSTPFIIAVDASLGKKQNIGKVNINEKPLKPGTGVNKTLPEVGHCHITGTVNVGGFMEFMVLQNTRLNTVINLTMVISKGIILAINYLTYNNYIEA